MMTPAAPLRGDKIFKTVTVLHKVHRLVPFGSFVEVEDRQNGLFFNHLGPLNSIQLQLKHSPRLRPKTSMMFYTVRQVNPLSS